MTEEEANEQGYSNIKILPGRGMCGTMQMAFTCGLLYGIDDEGYSGRWCYAFPSEAIEALKKWDGVGDPPGEWIKYKGKGGERARIPSEFEN